MSLIDDLAKWVEQKPLILMRFNDALSDSVRESRRGLEHFTFARPHSEFDAFKLPTLCLVELNEEGSRHTYVAVAERKNPVTTVDSRLKLVRLRELNLGNLKRLSSKVGEASFRTALQNSIRGQAFWFTLGPKLSAAVLRALASDRDNRLALESIALALPRLRRLSDQTWSQLDAVKTAMAIFGLTKSAVPDSTAVVEETDSALRFIGIHILEDNAIARDASVIPGFSFVERYLTGRAVFHNGQHRLDVYTANRGPLEEMFGVDLIYVNDTMGNVVMVQYKMLEEAASRGKKPDWEFRPDNQLRMEMSRMVLPAPQSSPEDYRLHRHPYFFKFVKRKDLGDLNSSFLISKDHLDQLLNAPESRGPRGGVRISYDALKGHYLRESDMIGLIRSGYVGTHRSDTAALATIIDEVAKGNRALVLAWQTRTKQDRFPEHEDDDQDEDW